MKLRLAGAIAASLLALCAPAMAENVQLPQTTSTQAPVTITTAGTFQSVLAANGQRHGCAIQNTSNDVEYVFFGANASATTASSLQLQPGQVINCSSDGVVLTDNVSMTSKTTNGATAAVVSQ